MEGKCKGCGFILGILIIVFALLGIPNVSKWVLVVIGAILLLHPIICKKCSPCCSDETAKAKPKKKRR